MTNAARIRIIVVQRHGLPRRLRRVPQADLPPDYAVSRGLTEVTAGTAGAYDDSGNALTPGSPLATLPDATLIDYGGESG